LLPAGCSDNDKSCRHVSSMRCTGHLGRPPHPAADSDIGVLQSAAVGIVCVIYQDRANIRQVSVNFRTLKTSMLMLLSTSHSSSCLNHITLFSDLYSNALLHLFAISCDHCTATFFLFKQC